MSSAYDRASAAGLLQAMPRRARVSSVEARVDGLHAPRFVPSAASATRAVARGARWSLALLRFAAMRLIDRLRGRRGVEQLAIRARELFEQMGGTAIKVGQQLAIRVDFLPFEVCQELGRLMDRVPPFGIDYALARIEANTGRPIRESFRSIDPNPIGSASIACVFKGTLHDGQVVAIKVRRPGVMEVFVTDLQLINWATRTIEALTLVRSGFFKYLRHDLYNMFMDEMDFEKEAIHQRMFRRYARRDKMEYVDAPRVHLDLSGGDVLVTEFVLGYSCVDILTAFETQDTEALQKLAAQGITPAEVGVNIIQLALWFRYELPFFHADPHPGNILVLPGSRLVMLDFGACGTLMRSQAAQQNELVRRLVQDDIHGAAVIALANLAPYPPINLDLLRRRIEEAFWDAHLASLDKHAEWWERTTASLWLGLVSAAQEFNLPVNLTVLRLTRATLQYDTLACRLNPSLNVINCFKAWGKAAARRRRRRVDRQHDAWRADEGEARLIEDFAQLRETTRRAAFWIDQVSTTMPRDFVPLATLGAAIASAILHALLFVTLVGMATVAYGLVAGLTTGIDVVVADLARGAATNPLVIFLVFFLGIIQLGRLRKRLSAKKN